VDTYAHVWTCENSHVSVGVQVGLLVGAYGRIWTLRVLALFRRPRLRVPNQPLDPKQLWPPIERTAVMLQHRLRIAADPRRHLVDREPHHPIVFATGAEVDERLLPGGDLGPATRLLQTIGDVRSTDVFLRENEGGAVRRFVPRSKNKKHWKVAGWRNCCTWVKCGPSPRQVRTTCELGVG
jgi:hypothetical protein